MFSRRDRCAHSITVSVRCDQENREREEHRSESSLTGHWSGAVSTACFVCQSCRLSTGSQWPRWSRANWAVTCMNGPTWRESEMINTGVKLLHQLLELLNIIRVFLSAFVNTWFLVLWSNTNEPLHLLEVCICNMGQTPSTKHLKASQESQTSQDWCTKCLHSKHSTLQDCFHVKLHSQHPWAAPLLYIKCK